MAGTKVDYTKKYLDKVNSRLAAIDGQDPFYQFCSNAIDGGDNIFFQKYRVETRLFDFDWIDTVEEAIDKIDNIVRNPKSHLREDNDVVPIEKAKRTGYEAVKHLSSHSQFVKEVTPEGFVRPTKILTTERDIDYAIYENRFVKTLLLKLVPFVEKRYDALVKLMNSDYFNKLNSKSKFNFNGTDVEYELNMSIHRKINDGDKAEHNALLLERAKIVRTRVMGFYNSEFMQNLASAREVFPPIQRTNILMKEPNYHKCYQLWTYLSEQGDFKYEIDVKEAEIDFTNDYKNQIKHLTLLAYATSSANDPAFGSTPFDKNVFVPVKPKEMKVLKNIDEEARDNSLKMETDIINEFYYQEARKLYRKNIDSKVNDGEPYHIALKDVYMQATKITDAIFNSLLEVPDDIKDNPVALLRFKKRKLEAFKAIIKFKEQDLAKWRKAQAKLENEIIKDTVKANVALGVKDKDALEKERKAAEKAIAKERAKEAARLAREKEKEKAREAIQRIKAQEAAKKAIEAEQARLAREAIKEAKELERQRKAEERAERARIAEEKRKQREAEMAARQAERERIAQEKEAARLAKEKEEREKILALASAEGFDEDDEVVVDENGERIPPKSFVERLKEASDDNKGYYEALKAHLGLYYKVESKESFRFDNYSYDGDYIAKVGFGGSTLKLYLALDPKEYDIEKYEFNDLSDSSYYEKVPMMLKVKSNEALENAKALIDELASKKGIITVEKAESKLDIKSKPFAVKFKEASKETKALYRALKKHILQYPVSEVPSKKHIAFKKGENGKTLVLVNFGGKTLKSFFAIDPSEVNRKEFYHTDVKEYKAYETTPSLIKLSNDVNLERACKLVDAMMEKLGIAKGKLVKADVKDEEVDSKDGEEVVAVEKVEVIKKPRKPRTKKETPVEEKPTEEIKEETPTEEAKEETPTEEVVAVEKVEAIKKPRKPRTKKETPVEEKPTEEIKEEIPIEEVKEDEPVEETPVEEVKEETPVEETPVEEVKEDEPVEETPTEEVKEDEPVEETPTEESNEEPVEETPTEESNDEPTEETPTEEAKENEPAEGVKEEPRRRGLLSRLFGRRNRDEGENQDSSNETNDEMVNDEPKEENPNDDEERTYSDLIDQFELGAQEDPNTKGRNGK